MKQPNLNFEDTNKLIAIAQSGLSQEERAKRIKNVLAQAHTVPMQRVHCTKCNRDIGDYFIQDGRNVYSKLAGLLSARRRMDGTMGYQCDCGNYSVLCAAEQGIITADVPTAAQLQMVYERMNDDAYRSKVKESRGGAVVECDGFITTII